MRGVRLRIVRRAACLVLATTLSGCELREITLAEPERAVVAEAYVWVGGPGAPGSSERTAVSVMLHETLDASGGSGPVSRAGVVVTRPSDGLRIDLVEQLLGHCAITIPVRGSGTCYRTVADEAIDPPVGRLRPGDRLELRIDLADGGVLTSETVVPGAFQLRNVAAGEACALPPARQTELVWSRSAGAWAYVSDTYVTGLGPIFGAAVVDDPLYLLGLSVSAQDTTIAFPAEFGLFARSELDRGVSVALQAGLPPGTSAEVSVAAVDRNWVNWARGGNFNPSGVVRVPSVRGAGTGVFAAGVVQRFGVVAGEPGPQMAACPLAGADATG